MQTLRSGAGRAGPRTETMANPAPSSALRIACQGLADDEIAALRRLLGLLQSHLSRPWALARGSEPADVVVVNLDAGRAPPVNANAAVVGCSTKPRQHPEGTLYRPIRAYQLLSLLSELGSRPAAPETARPAQEQACRYRLKHWPAQAMNWTPDWWAVMAAIRGVQRTPEEIVAQTGVPVETVRLCLAQLARSDALEREVLAASAPSDAAAANVNTRWRALTRRVGQVLGFAR